MKKIFNMQKWCCLLAVAVMLAGCKDDETPISVTGIFVHSAEDTATQLERVRLGEMVRISGTGFATTKAVYCNGVEVGGINRNYVTDTDIIFRMPESIPIGSEVENINDLNTIRIVTEEQSFVYNIPILGHTPSVTGISHTLPKAGDVIEIYGRNLRALSSITFPGDVAVEVGGFTESEDYTTVTVTVPEGGDVTPGAICLEGISGGTYTYSYMNRSAGIFLSTFDGEGEDTYGRKAEADASAGLAATEIKTDAVPAVTRGEPGSPAAYCVMPGEPANLNPETLDGKNVGWVSFDCMKALERITADPKTGITRNTSCDDLAFQADCYMTVPWTCGAFRIELVANNSTYRQTTISWIENGVVSPVAFSGWRTVTMPCSYVSGMTGKTLGELMDEIQNKYDGIFKFQLGAFQVNAAGSYYRGNTMSGCQVYAGNIRLVPYTQPFYNNN